MDSARNFKKIVLEPLTRVEGHGKVTLLLDEHNHVQQARLHIAEFRGFERFIQGRPFWEVPVLVQRLCGICPVSHHLAAAKAMDRIVGADRLTPTAEKMRRLMHYGQIFQSHVLHFFHLASPDLLFGFDADPSRRNVLAVAETHPELVLQGVMMRKFGQEIIRVTAGKKIHGTGAVPGGVNRHLEAAERDSLLKELPQMTAWARSAVKLARDYTEAHLEMVAGFANFPSSFLSLVGPAGELELYDGTLKAIDARGHTLFEKLDCQDYSQRIMEEVKPWSYMKFPFFTGVAAEDAAYRVGPLARLNNCLSISTPLAETERRIFTALGRGAPVLPSLAYHWARMIEALHAVEMIGQLLEDPDLLRDDLMASGRRRGEAVGVIEAPRGTLIHHYVVGDDDLVRSANLIVSTTHNNNGMNEAVTSVARSMLDGQPTITEALLNHLEVAIRAYDPCLSCATHALGRMALEVDLLGPGGALLDRRGR